MVMRGMRPENARARLLSKCDRSGGPEACWPWLGCLAGDGEYGSSKLLGELRAHRAMWVSEHGPIPPGAKIRHTCEMRLCVNPAHLALAKHRGLGDTKLCGDCEIEKPRSDFSLRPRRPGADKHHYLCRECERDRCRRYAKARPDVCRSSKYRRRYGISLEEWNRLFAEQGGACAICRTHQSELKQMLGVDHDHETGRVRALLCRLCNAMLGSAKDDVNRLEAAVAYLVKHGQ